MIRLKSCFLVSLCRAGREEFDRSLQRKSQHLHVPIKHILLPTASFWERILDCESQFEVGIKFCNVGSCLCSRRNMLFSLQLFSICCFMIIQMLLYSQCCCNAPSETSYFNRYLTFLSQGCGFCLRLDITMLVSVSFTDLPPKNPGCTYSLENSRKVLSV